MTDAEVVSRFARFGDNRELGSAQKMAGIDPFGLFFEQTPVIILLELLQLLHLLKLSQLVRLQLLHQRGCCE